MTYSPIDTMQACYNYSSTWNFQPFMRFQAPTQSQSHPIIQPRPLQKFKAKDITLYKTELCRNWIELGLCRYGDRCRYAHGEDEIRTKHRHARYKTEICRAYFSEGTCPYGIRCTFIHDSESTPDHSTHSVQRPVDLIWNSRLGLDLHDTQPSFPVVSFTRRNSLTSQDEVSSESSGDENISVKSPLSDLLSMKYKTTQFSLHDIFKKTGSTWF